MDLTPGAGLVAALSGTEDVRRCVGLHIETDSAVHPEETNDARVKKVRKADSMGTITAEPLAVPEKKMKRTEDGVLSAESETQGRLSDPQFEPMVTPEDWKRMNKQQRKNWRARHI